MTAAAEAIYICIDNSDWMKDSNNFDAQCDAIEFYCKTKFNANSDSVVGLLTMGSCDHDEKNPLLYPPSMDLGEIMDIVQDIDPGYGLLDIRGASVSSLLYLGLSPPGLKKRILFFVGGCTNLNQTAVDKYAKLFREDSIAIDVVNFYLDEERWIFTPGGYHYGRSALDALVTATNVDGNSRIVHVLPNSSIKDVLSKSILENYHAVVDDDHARPLGIECDRHVPGETLAN